MEYFTNEVMGDLLAQSLETAEIGPNGFHDIGAGPGSTAGKDIDWLTISDRQQSVVEDVRRIRNHPLVPSRIPIYGYVYNVGAGSLDEVADATEAGRAL
jgi:carbonic anhydrase